MTAQNRATMTFSPPLAVADDEALVRVAKDLADAAAIEATSGEHLGPGKVVFRIAGGKRPIRAWREHRNS